MDADSKNVRERIIVSVGGSLIVPDKIDTDFIVRFREFILKKVGEGLSFFIITGGGRTARLYQEAGRAVRGDELSREDIDWLGIHATRLNAHLLRVVFLEQAYNRFVKDPTEHFDTHDPIIVGAGWKPGWSTDYCAVLAAKTLGATRLVNLSDIDYVYDKDPKKNPDAQKFENLSWAEFRKIIPDKWDPGLSSPFDPIAAKEADESKLEIAMINGANLAEFANYLDGKPFAGTVIK
jgi:uridylate kinase